jgi:hypothetical protein
MNNNAFKWVAATLVGISFFSVDVKSDQGFSKFGPQNVQAGNVIVHQSGQVKRDREWWADRRKNLQRFKSDHRGKFRRDKGFVNIVQ